MTFLDTASSVGVGGVPLDRAPTRAPRSARDVVLLLVTWAGLLALIGAPLAYVVLGAVSGNPLIPGTDLTLNQFRRVLTDVGQLRQLGESLLFAAAIGVLATVIAAAFAWSTVRLRVGGARIRETLIMGALFVPPFVTAVTWVWLATPTTGLVNRWLTSLGVPGWLHLNALSLGGMMFIMVTHQVPYAYLFISAAARKIDSRMEEASLLCGRGSFYTTMRISMPLLRSSLLSSALFIAILSLGEFSVPLILGQQGAFKPLAVSVYQALYGSTQDYGYASAIATELMFVALIGLFFYLRAVRHSERFVSVGGRGLQHTEQTPRRITSTVVWAGTLVYGLLAVVVPLVGMIVMAMTSYVPPSLKDIHLSFRYLWEALDTAEVGQATLNTLELSIAVPIVCIVIAVLVVYLSERARVRSAGAMSYLATAPLAVPGLVMGTGFLLYLIRTPLYGTLAIIGIGLTAICLTHAVRLVSNGFKQLDPSLEEASRMCGVSASGTIRRIVLPLLRPTIFSAFVLVFTLALRELTVAVVLYAPSTQVLSVVGWNYATSALNKACAIGLFQIALMFVSVPILRTVFRLKRGE